MTLKLGLFSCQLGMALLSVVALGVNQPAVASGQGECRLAIAAMPSVESIGDLVTAALGSRPELPILERIALDQILSERRLDYGRVDSRLAGADAVLLLEEVTMQSERLLVARLTGCRKGLAIWSEAYPLSRDPGSIAGDIATTLPLAVKRLTAEGDLQVVSVSLSRFGPRFDPSQPADRQAVEAAGFVRLLAGALSSRPGLALTERLSLDLPGLENLLAGIERPGYASADYFVEGDFTLGESGSTATLSITPAGASQLLKRDVQSPTGDRGSLVAAIAAEIDRGIGELATQQAGKPLPGMIRKDDALAPATEADAAFDEAQRLYQLKQYTEAARRAASARELGIPHHPGLTAIALKSLVSAAFLDISGGKLPSRMTGAGYSTGVASSPHPLEPYPDGDLPVSEAQWARLVDAAWALHDTVTRLLPIETGGRTTLNGLPAEPGKSPRPVVTTSSGRPWLEDELLLTARVLTGYYEINLWETVVSRGPEAASTERRRELHSVLLLIRDAFRQKATSSPPAFQNPFTEIVYLPGLTEAVAHLDGLLAPKLPAGAGTPESVRSTLESKFFELRNRLSRQIPTGEPYPGEGAMPGGANTVWKFAGGESIRLGDLITEAVKPRGDDRDLVRQTDSKLFAIYESPDEKTASERTRAARDWLVAHSDALAERELLSAYGIWLVSAESAIHWPGSIAKPDSNTKQWWQSFHTLVTEKQKRLGSIFTPSLLATTLEDRDFWEGTAEQAIAELERYNASVPDADRLRPFALNLLRDRFLKPAAPNQPGVAAAGPEDHTIVGYAYTYPGRKLIQTAHVDGVFYFLVASEWAEDAEVVVYDSATIQFTDFIKIPSPVSDHMAEQGMRNDRSSIMGAIHVNDERIVVVARGSIGQYDRRSKQWTTRELPFLKDKKGFRCLEDRLFCYDGMYVRRYGGPLSESVPDPHGGFYAVDLKTLAISTYFDTARRPAVVREDEASIANFSSHPVPLGSNEVIASFEAVPQPGGAYRFSDGEKFSRVGPSFTGTVGVNWHNGKVFVTTEGRRLKALNQTEPAQISLSSFLVRADVDRGMWQLINTEPGIPGSFQFPAEYRQSDGFISGLDPLVWTNDTEMLFLSTQRTGNKKQRYLYYWPAGKKDAPIRIALRLGGVVENTKDGNPEDFKRRLEEDALSSVEQIFLDDKNLVFITRKGAWFRPRKSWDEYIRNRLGSP